jgi:transcriptional regulator with XRE-family HTH domain
MKSKEVTRSQLAKKLGTSPAYITKVFRGDANFTIESMVRFCRALDGNLHIHVADEDSKVRWFDIIEQSNKFSDSPFGDGAYGFGRSIKVEGNGENEKIAVAA